MKLKDIIQNKRIDRWERMMNAVQNRIKYNPEKAQFNLDKYLDSDLFTKRIQEYKVWNTGNSYLIKQFYQSGAGETYEDLKYFWKEAPDKLIKKHCGIPKQIANKMGGMIFGSDFRIKAVVYKRDEEGKVTDAIDEQASKKATDNINALIDKMELVNKWRNQATIDSWCGHTFAKLNYDLKLSNYPIYEVFDLTGAESIVERGITTGYIFKSRYHKKVGNTIFDYEFQEKYTTNENGDAVIYNELYRVSSNGLERVALTEIPELATLEDEYVFDGVKGLVAFGKPNMLPNNEFPNCNYGASDYAGAIDSFDAMDEAYSELYTELRNNKTIRYIPSTMLREGIKLDPFVTNYQQVEGSLDQQAKNELNIQHIDDKTESILAKYRNALTTAINIAGLSPLALGITGLEAINAGEQSQRERNRVSLETRKDKINSYWIPYLSNFLTQLLAFNNWMVKSGVVQEGIELQEISFDNCDIQFDFGNYVVESETDIINRWSTAKTSGIASLETIIRELHTDWSEEQITQEVNRIKFESNMALDDPTLLQMDFTTNEDTE